jgi:hypothetical protein
MKRTLSEPVVSTGQDLVNVDEDVVVNNTGLFGSGLQHLI